MELKFNDHDPWIAAAVTGAASGIGGRWRLKLAARGCDLALADRDETGLQTVAAEINRTHSRKVTAHRVDVSERSRSQTSRRLRHQPSRA